MVRVGGKALCTVIGDTNVCRVLFVALWVASHALHVARDGVRPRASRERKETRTVAVVYGWTSVARVMVMYLTLLPPRPPFEYVYLYYAGDLK